MVPVTSVTWQGPGSGLLLKSKQREPPMNKATKRFTAAQRQMEQAKKDRRQAAIERQQDDWRQDEIFVKMASAN